MKVLMIHVPSQNPSLNSGPETVPMDHTHHTHLLLASPNPCPFPQHWVSIQVLKRVQDVKSIVLYRCVFEHVDLFYLKKIIQKEIGHIYIYINYKYFCKKIRVLSFIFSWSLLTSPPLISLRVVVSEPWKNFDGSWITWDSWTSTQIPENLQGHIHRARAAAWPMHY
jgi:hypothetical protein